MMTGPAASAFSSLHATGWQVAEALQTDVYLVNSKLGCTLLLEVDKAVALGLVGTVCGNLAGQDGSKGAEGVMESLVVNFLV